MNKFFNIENAKVNSFKDEIELIKNERIKDFLIGAIKDIPLYFFEEPASSSGKHQPTNCN